jgi:hypothetical protein
MHKLMGLFVVALAAVTAPLAQANIQITYTIDGSAGVASPCGGALGSPTPPGSVDCGPGNIGNAAVTITSLTGFSNSPGGLLGLETGSNTVIENNSTASHHIIINIVADNYTSPSGTNVGFLSHIGGTVAVGSTDNTLTFTSCVDTGNSLTGCPGTSFVNGSPDVTAVGSYSNDKSGVGSGTLTTPFSIGEKIDLVIGAGSVINFSSSTTLAQNVPEPMSITLLGGVILLVSRSIRRKHNQVS